MLLFYCTEPSTQRDHLHVSSVSIAVSQINKVFALTLTLYTQFMVLLQR